MKNQSLRIYFIMKKYQTNKSMLLNFLFWVFFDGYLLELRLRDQRIIDLCQLILTHLFAKFHQLFVNFIIFWLDFQNLFEASVCLWLPLYFIPFILRPTKAFAFRWKALEYVGLIAKALSQSSIHFPNS